MDYKQKEILQKFSTQKVDLALIDKLKQMEKESYKAYINYINDMDASKGFMSRAIDKAEIATKKLKEQIEIFTDIELAYDKLGIDLPSNIEKLGSKAPFQIAEKDLSMMKSLYAKFKVR
jgi:hypothetical protein